MQDAFAIVLFVVVGIGIVVAIASLFTRGRLYDDIGRGGLYVDEGENRRGGGAPPPPNPAERDAEIRQMLEARNARRTARGEAAVDVEAELQALTRPGASAAADPEIRQEVRALVEARNARRLARGRPPIDVEAEIERQLRDLPG
jgi:hypothetical protein